MQTDHSLGLILAELDRLEIADNTLVVLTSDNGCSPQADFPELLSKGHNPSHLFRGHKADIFEGGHHIPFIVRWPAKVKPGTKSDQLLCLTDLIATCADILKVALPANAGEDSVSFLPALLGQDKSSLREALVHHSVNGTFAIRQGNMKLLMCKDSGGWSDPRPGTVKSGIPELQLFDLSNDIGERNNLHDKQSETVIKLTNLLEKYIADGRSTKGEPQKNDVKVDWKRATQTKDAGKAKDKTKK
jgi:arylsulfatase A-like enzyme